MFAIDSGFVRWARRRKQLGRWLALGLGGALLSLGLLACQDPATGAGGAGSPPEYLYVTDSGSSGPNGISGFSVGARGALTPITSGTFTTGNGPLGVAASANGDYLYVTDSASGNGAVSTFAIERDGSLSAVPGASCGSGTGGAANCASIVGGGFSSGTPALAAVSPAGDYLFVTNSASTGTDGVTPFTFSSTTGALTAGTAAATGSDPQGAAVTPNGDFLYVANMSTNTVSGFSVGSGGALSNIGGGSAATTYTAGAHPWGVAVSPNGDYLYVTNGGCTASSSCDGLSAFTTNQGSIDGQLSPISGGSVTTGGAFPEGIAITPDGSYLYVANYGTGNLSAYEIGSGGVPTSIGSYSTGSGPTGIAVTPDGSYLYVANKGSDSVSAYAIGAGGALTSVGSFSTGTGSSPEEIAIVSK